MNRRGKRLPPGAIVAPNSLLIAAVTAKRAASAKAAAAESRPAREPVAVDAPPMSSSDEEEEGDERRGDMERTTFTSSASGPAVAAAAEADHTAPISLRQRPAAKRLLIAAGRRRESVGGGGDESSGSNASNGKNGDSRVLRGTKRPHPKEQALSPPLASRDGNVPNETASTGGGIPFERARKAPPRTAYSRKTSSLLSGGRSGSSSAKSSQERPAPTFKTYEDASGSESDLSEPPKAATTAKAGKAPRGAPRFIRPPEMSPEKKSPPKKFRHSRFAGSDEGEEQEEDTAPKATFKWPSGAGGKDDQQRETREQEDRPKTKAKATTWPGDKRAPGKKAPPAVAKGATLDSLQSRQKWRQRQQLQRRQKRTKTSLLFGKLDLEAQSDGGGDGDGGHSDEPDADEPPSSSQRAVFKMPTGFGDGGPDEFAGDYGGGGSGDDNGDVRDISLLLDDRDDSASCAGSESDGTMALKEPAACPLCKAPLDEDTLRALLPTGHGGGDNNVRLNLLKFDDKLRFCAGHKQRAGRQAWTAQGYPAIDWAALPARLERHYAHVESVLLGATPSVFREELKGRPSGRPLQTQGRRPGGQSSQSLNNNATNVSNIPGYYGRHGLRVLSDAIVERLSDALRRRAVDDPLVAARGMAQFVRAVLVPELAVQLIREDMASTGPGRNGKPIDEDEARRILRASAALGEAVMDEERDVVLEDEEDDGYDDDLDEDGDDEAQHDGMAV